MREVGNGARRERRERYSKRWDEGRAYQGTECEKSLEGRGGKGIRRAGKAGKSEREEIQEAEKGKEKKRVRMGGFRTKERKEVG